AARGAVRARRRDRLRHAQLDGGAAAGRGGDRVLPRRRTAVHDGLRGSVGGRGCGGVARGVGARRGWRARAMPYTPGAMVMTPSQMLPLGTEAPAFRLPDPSGRMVSLDDQPDAKGYLVVFMCN